MACCENQNDSCACRPCTYPNGIVVLILCQIMLFIGWILSLSVLIDCQFVTVDPDLVDPFLTSIFPTATITSNAADTKRGLGFFFYEGTDGKCSWERNHTEDSFHEYLDFLGSDWDAPRDLAGAAAGFAFIFWIWVLIFCCVAHHKVLRCIFATLVTIMLTVLQAVIFVILKSDFCRENDCKIGRTAGYAIAAAPLFFISGVLLFCTKDYPGHPRDTTVPLTTTTVADTQKATAVNDAPTVQHEEHDEEEANRHHQFGEEVPVQSDLVDVSLVDSTTTTAKVNNAAGTKATVY